MVPIVSSSRKGIKQNFLIWVSHRSVFFCFYIWRPRKPFLLNQPGLLVLSTAHGKYRDIRMQRTACLERLQNAAFEYVPILRTPLMRAKRLVLALYSLATWTEFSEIVHRYIKWYKYKKVAKLLSFVWSHKYDSRKSSNVELCLPNCWADRNSPNCIATASVQHCNPIYAPVWQYRLYASPTASFHLSTHLVNGRPPLQKGFLECH